MYPGCKNYVTCRGLCNNHYSAASFIVRNGKATWDDLIKAGKCRVRVNRNAWLLEGVK